jgi:hypothetical protein
VNEPETEPEVLLIGEITVREFIPVDEGERFYSVDYGDMPLSTILGMLRLAEHWVLAEHLGDDDDE